MRAAVLRQKYGRKLVLIIDDGNSLQKKEPGLLVQLQDSAKAWADSGDITVVFASSEGAGKAALEGA